MVKYDANVVVHIDENLTNEQIHEIEKRLSSVKGVVSACAHVRTPHLFVPKSIHNGQLLQEVKNGRLNA